MGRNRKDLNATSKVAGQLSFATLARSLPRDVVDEEIARDGRKQKRTRMLPACLMVYYTLRVLRMGAVAPRMASRSLR